MADTPNVDKLHDGSEIPASRLIRRYIHGRSADYFTWAARCGVRRAPLTGHDYGHGIEFGIVPKAIVLRSGGVVDLTYDIYCTCNGTTAYPCRSARPLALRHDLPWDNIGH